MRVGNWKVGNDGIEWVGQFADNFYIEPHRIIEIGSGEMSDTYHWLLILTQKYWTSKKDIYDLDAAFAFALIQFDLKFDPVIYAKTLYEQNRIINFSYHAS